MLGLVARGLSGKEIAGELSLSVHTVLSHIRNARAKLEAPSKLAAVMTAVRRGLLSHADLPVPAERTYAARNSSKHRMNM